MSETKKMMGALVLTWIMIVGMLGYIIWDKKQIFQREGTNPSAIAEIKKAQQSLGNQLKAIASLYDQQFQQIAEHDQQLVASLNQLDQALHAGTSAWALTQIQHYIEQAIIVSDLLKNPEGALQLLDIADLQLQRIGNPNLLPLRQAIATDKQILTSGISTTRENVILALNAVIDVLPTVKQRTELLAPITPSVSEAKAEPMTWKAHVLTSLAELKSLIVVRHHTDSIEPYFSPNEAAVLNENIQLMLLQAGYAASTGNQKLYDNHLQMAIAWFNRYYDTQSPVGSNIANTLNNLKNQIIEAKKIDTFASIGAWNELLKSKPAIVEVPNVPVFDPSKFKIYEFDGGGS